MIFHHCSKLRRVIHGSGKDTLFVVSGNRRRAIADCLENALNPQCIHGLPLKDQVEYDDLGSVLRQLFDCFRPNDVSP